MSYVSSVSIGVWNDKVVAMIPLLLDATVGEGSEVVV